MTIFSFGSDPEFSVSNNNKIISAIGIVPGHKKAKYLMNGHHFYYDNVLAECNIKPGFNKQETIENIRDAIKTYLEVINPYELNCIAAHDYDRNQLSHPDALEIGCDPEWCCYTLKEYRPDREYFAKSRIRTAGGHIHIGHDLLKTVSSINRYRFIRIMDLFVGIPSIFIDSDPTAKIRKQLYGDAGRFRKQAHGAEYRSLGNFWLQHPHLTELIYDLTEFAVQFLENEADYDFWKIDLATLKSDAWNEPGFDPARCHVCSYDVPQLIEAIKTHDREKAEPFMKIIQSRLPPELFQKILTTNAYSTNLRKNWE